MNKFTLAPFTFAIEFTAHKIIVLTTLSDFLFFYEACKYRNR